MRQFKNERRRLLHHTEKPLDAAARSVNGSEEGTHHGDSNSGRYKLVRVKSG